MTCAGEMHSYERLHRRGPDLVCETRRGSPTGGLGLKGMWTDRRGDSISGFHRASPASHEGGGLGRLQWAEQGAGEGRPPTSEMGGRRTGQTDKERVSAWEEAAVAPRLLARSTG